MADQLVDQSTNRAPVQEVKVKKKWGLFSKTKFYVFEYTVLQLSVLMLGSSFATAIFAMFGTMSGHGSLSASLESLVWVFGLSLVLVPLVTVLYARTSAEEALHPARHDQTPRKFVFYGMLVLSTIAALSFLIAAVYTVSRVAFGLSSTDMITQVALPSIVMFGLTIYYIFAIQKNFAPSRKLRKINILTVSIFGALVTLSILIAASVSGSSTRADQQVVSDLNATQKSVNIYYRDNNKLPKEVSDTDLESGVKSKFEAGEYKYSVINDSNDYGNIEAQDSDLTTTVYPSPQDSSYKLCATFKASKGYNDDYSYGSYSASIDYHKKGYQCVTLYAY